MQIIFNKDAAEQLGKTHTVLELETFMVEGKEMPTFCVVPIERIPLSDLPGLANYIELHMAFVQAIKDKNTKLCNDLAEHLIGKFGGELDTFYEEILKRFALEQSSNTT